MKKALTLKLFTCVVCLLAACSARANECPHDSNKVYPYSDISYHEVACGACLQMLVEQEAHTNAVEHTAELLHIDTCQLCEFTLSYDSRSPSHDGDINTHQVICGIEGCEQYFYTEAHEFVYTDKLDGKTHDMICAKCKYDAANDYQVEHNYAYSQTSESHERSCTLCEYKSVEAHVIGAHYDDTHHWTSCECGYDMKDKSEHAKIYAHTGSSHIETCGGCDFKYEELNAVKYSSDAGTHRITCDSPGCPMNGLTEAHTGGSADCYNKAVCEVCENEYGKFVHSIIFVSNNDGTHAEKCAICPRHFSDGVCSGGDATCALQAVCSICEGPYGDTRAHKYSSAYTSIGNDKHAKVCVYSDCGEYADAQACAGGSATCQTLAVCETCAAEYGALGAHSYAEAYTSLGDDTHARYCVTAGCAGHDTALACAGGSATCQALAICSTCDTVYGALGAHDYAETHSRDEHYLLCALCGDSPDSSRARLGWAHLDKDTHVYACPAEGCAVRLDTQPHAFRRVSVSADYHREKCVICGYLKTAFNHTMTWRIDKCIFIAECKHCDYRYTKAAHAFDIWESAANARHASECAVCQAAQDNECEYFAIERDETRIEICPICGDTLIDGARSANCEYVEGASMTELEDNAIPGYARLRVFKFERGYTITLEYLGETVKPLGAIRVDIPVENGEPVIIEITQNGIYGQ